VSTLEPFAALAESPWILVILFAWGVGEALVLPVVPDVLIGILAMAAPERAPILLGAAILGGVLGALAAWRMYSVSPAVGERVLALQPGLGQHGLDAAERRLRQRGLVAGFAQVGPGLPLKAYLHALAAVAPQRPPGTVAGLALVNRLTRLVPVTLVFAALHPLAQSSGWSPPLLPAVYATGWIVFYAAYWIARDPRRGG
jgi:membrane protein YqaA with SNARE-associated domain